MAGRTWLQQATPITFGLKAAGWLDALDRGADRVESRLTDASVLQFGGASGTLAALGDRGPAVAARLGEMLGLTSAADALARPPGSSGGARLRAGRRLRHGGQDRAATLACSRRPKFDEAHEPASAAGGSSTMPHKRNPVRAAIAVAAALRAPGLVATMLRAMLQEHERGLGGWQAEWDTIPELVIAAGDAARGARRGARGADRRSGTHAHEPGDDGWARSR